MTRKFAETGAGDLPRGQRASSLSKFQEASLGREVHATKTRGQFLRHDGQVLCFDCVWDDRRSWSGELHKYKLHFFLADDTIEVCEVRERNDGHEPYPRLLSRRKLLKDPTAPLHDDRPRSIEAEPARDEYLLAGDLRLGARISVLGRDLLLHDCDSFTREYYRREHGVEVEPVDVSEPRPPKAAMEIPPHIGIGSEEDSLGSVYHLVPKKPKSDVTKLLYYDGKILRFLAKMLSSNPDDEDRQFVIAFYLADDTVSVYEPPVKNSGVVSGKFLERGRYKREGGAGYFRPEDFQIGNRVRLSSHTFEVKGMDDYSFKYLLKRPTKFPFFDVKRLIRSVRTKLQSRHGEDQLHATFKELDTVCEGHLCGWRENPNADLTLPPTLTGPLGLH